MWLFRFRLRVRTLLSLVVLVALVLTGLRVYNDGPESHWLLLKLRYGKVEARRSAAARAWELGVSGMFQNVIAPVVMGPDDPQGSEASCRLQKRRAELLCPALIQTIKDPDPICRANALKALAILTFLNASDSDKSLVLPHILAAARDPDASVRAAAVGSMASLAGQDTAGVIDAIRSALTDSSVEVRQAAAWELGMLRMNLIDL